MTAQLKLCPFCKAKLSISSSGLASHDNRDRRKCLISSMSFPIEDLAQLNGWNHRPIEQQLIEALEAMTKEYVDLVNCGDCGFWDAEQVESVSNSRAAVKAARGEA